MPTVSLPANGVTGDGIELNASGATITQSGTNPPLADSSNLTGIGNATSAPLDYMVRFQTLGSSRAVLFVGLNIRLSLTGGNLIDPADGDTLLFLQNGNPTDTTGTYVVGQFADGTTYGVPAVIPSPHFGTVHDLSLTLLPAPGLTLADCAAVLRSGAAYLDVHTVSQNNPAVDQSGFVYEASLDVVLSATAPAIPPPLRRYPPVNNGGSGPTRHWPRTVNRRAGGTY